MRAGVVEFYQTEVFAVAAVLPLDFDWRLSLTFEVDFAKQMTAIFTLDGTLPRSEKSSFVFRAEYSHFRSSLQRRVTVNLVPGTQHVDAVGGLTELQMKKSGKRFADTRID